MNFRNVHTILRKELTETLRDKRAMFAMIGIPVILYPLLFVVAAQVGMMQHGRTKERESKVAVTKATAPIVRQWISENPKIRMIESPDPRGELKAGKIDAVVTAGGNIPEILAGKGSAEIQILYDETEVNSKEAEARIRKELVKQQERLQAQRLNKAGISKDYLDPLHIREENIASTTKTAGSFLGSFLPMILIIMLAAGAYYPAVDLTAGEKERGTFETLLATPTSKMEIVCGKFITVFILSLTTGLLNLASMVLTLKFQLAQVADKMGKESGPFSLNLFQISPLNVAIILVVLIPLAFFICSVMMSIAIFARNFKEAANYVTPFYVLIMIPGIFAGIPGVELTRATMFIPIANTALLFKGLLMQKAGVEMVFGVFLCTGVYALFSLVVAGWLFQREDIILSEEKGIPLTLRRSAFIPRKAPTMAMSLILFALSLLLMFYVGTYAQSREIISGLFISEWIVIFLPTVLILWYTRVNLVEALNLRRPRIATIPAAILMGAGMLVLVIQGYVWQNRVLPMPEWFIKEMSQVFHYHGTLKELIVLLLATALSPAVCEEVLFRGAVLSGVRTRLGPVASVLMVGILFGLMHVSVYRVVPTALLGIGITYLVLRSGSIFTGMLVHLIVNTTGVLAENRLLPRLLQQYIENGQIEEKGFSGWVLLGAVAVLAIGIFLLEIAGKPRASSK